MSNKPGCTVSLKHLPENSVHLVELRHYEELKRLLDDPTTAKGWIELDSVYGDGKIFCRLEDIADLFQAPPSYCEARDAWDKEQKAEDLTQ
jgi:hypothetical protein